MRGAVVRDALEAFERLGLNAGLVCERAGIDRASLDRPGARVPLANIFRLWEATEDLSGDRLVGLHAGEAIRVRSEVAYLARSQRTVAEALGQVVRFSHLAIDTVEAELDQRCGRPWLRLRLDGESPAKMRHIWEYWAVLISNGLSDATAGSFRLAEVRFPHAPEGPVREYERVFHCPVIFRQQTFELVLSTVVYGQPMLTHNPDLRQVFEREALKQLSLASSADLRIKVAGVLRSALERDESVPSELIAARLGISHRTLQRRLRQEGTSVVRIRDEVRREYALELLDRRTSTISEIATKLGFAEVASFSRAFKRWTGQSPRALRLGARQGEHRSYRLR